MARRPTRSSGVFDLYPQFIAGESNATYYDYLLGLHLLEEGVSIPVQEKIAELIDCQHVQTKKLNSAIKVQTRELGSKLDEQTGQLKSININLKAIEGAISHQTSIIDWRLGQVVERLEGISDSLEALLELAKNPSQVWAYEQFDIARDAYRRRLYDDALTYVNQAIAGHGSQTGYNLDYRFHALKGHIRMGSIENTSSHIVSPKAAEECFVKAAEYAASVSSIATSECLCFAAVAALGFGDENRANEHIERALKFHEYNAEAKFLQAKLNFRHGDTDAGGPQLIVAMSIDNGYVLKALMDGDIENHTEARDRAIVVFHDMQRENLLARFQPFINCIDEFRTASRQLPAQSKAIISEPLELSNRFSEFGKKELARIENAGIFTLNNLDHSSYEIYDAVLEKSKQAISSALAKGEHGYMSNNAGTYTLFGCCLGGYVLGLLLGWGAFWSVFLIIPGVIVGFISSFIAEDIVSKRQKNTIKSAALEAKKAVDSFVKQNGEINVKV